ncbi:MAG: TadE family protein [Actinomycetes bacterium]
MDFVLVGGLLLTPLFLGVVQLGLDLHVRNTLVACASEGARYAANADRTLADGETRTKDCITSSLRASYADDVHGLVVMDSGAPIVEMTVKAPLPVVAFAGPSRALVVHGHALQEHR